MTVQFSGEAEATDEMADPRWFDVGAMPYDQMMPGDQLFIPKVFAGEKFTGWIRFDETGQKVDSYEFKNVNENSLVI